MLSTTGIVNAKYAFGIGTFSNSSLSTDSCLLLFLLFPCPQAAASPHHREPRSVTPPAAISLRAATPSSSLTGTVRSSNTVVG